MHLKDSEEIFNLAYETKLNSSYKFIVKTHPLLNKKQVQDKIIISKSKKFTYSNKSLYDLFDESEFIITSASSVCLEAILFGLKVIISGSRNSITKNNLKDIVDEHYWKVCYNSNDVINFINQNKKIIEYDTKSFFNLTNKETVKKFLSI